MYNIRMLKLTKIIATIGPVSDSPETIRKLIESGVNVFRFNFKHNSIDWHSDRIKRVNKIALEMGVPIGTLIDLQGPELRINMPKDQIKVEEGEILYFGENVFENNKKGFSITHPDIIPHLKDGQPVLADDGSFSFRVVKKGKSTFLASQTTGVLKNRKTLNIPGADFPFPVLIDRDFRGLELAARHDVDFIALSFVRTQSDLRTVRKEAKKYKVNAKLIAKIETEKALGNLDKIIESADGVMVARGDLGVEIPIEQVPFYQKMIIKKCIIKGKFVITATQMLQTMIEHPYPTRAEISDIANAVYDSTDCIMLSGETASGAHPLKTVEVMNKTAIFYEAKVDTDIRKYIQFSPNDSTAMICDTAYGLYREYVKTHQRIEGFVVFSQTGTTAKGISRYRPKVPIFAFVPTNEICESLTVEFGVFPFTFAFSEANEVSIADIKRATKILKDNRILKQLGTVIVIHGDQWGQGSGATTVRIV